MANYLNVLLDVLLYDSDFVTNDPADATKMFNRAEGMTISQATRLKMQVAIGGAYTSVPLVGASTDYIICKTDQPVTLTLNGGAPLPLTPRVVGKKQLVLFWQGNITSLQVANQGAVAANFDVMLLKI